MDFFNYKNGELYCEDVPAEKIAREVGTPAYVYSKATLLHHYRQIAEAFKPVNATICYSIKSCGNINLCKVLAAEGCGFDVTSGGELFRALQAGGDPKKMIYAGVGKTDEEIRRSARRRHRGVQYRVAKRRSKTSTASPASSARRPSARCASTPTSTPRPTPRPPPAERGTSSASTSTGPSGSSSSTAISSTCGIGGLHLHIGSPVYEIQPYVDAVTKAQALIDRLTARGHKIEWLDLGGGFAVNYKNPDQALPVTEHAKALLPLLKGKPYRIALEPGRYIVGNAGILLTQVLYRKTSGEKQFVIVDAGMNDLIRPTLYDCVSLHLAGEAATRRTCRRRATRTCVPVDGETVDVVGPICESGDYLAKDRPLPTTKRGDLLAVFTAGAYGFAMSSNYNNRPRAPEVLVDGDRPTRSSAGGRRTRIWSRPSGCKSPKSIEMRAVLIPSPGTPGEG